METTLSVFDGLFWWALALVALLFLQRALHREIQIIFLIITRSYTATMGLFAFLFLPGVFLHELSHFVMARLLGVRTGAFSLLPEPMPDGRLRLGYVEMARTDVLRDSLVGVAPLLFGSLFVSYVAIYQMHLVILWDTFRNGQSSLFLMGLKALPGLPDFWIWFYLAFIVSSSMMPSESDRYAWMPLGLMAGVLFVLALLAGAGPYMLDYLAPPLNQFLRGSALILLVSVVLHCVMIPPLFAIHRFLSRITGLDVDDGSDD